MGPTDMFQYMHTTYMDQVQPPSTILLHQALPKLLQPQFYAQVSCLCNFSVNEREHSVLVVLRVDYST